MTIALYLPAYRVSNDMGGVGVRAWDLAQALAPHAPVAIVARGPADLHHRGITFVNAADDDACQAALDEASAVISYDLPDTRELIRLFRRDTLLIADNAPPVEHLEYQALRASADPDAAYEAIVAGYELQVLLSDHFLVQSQVGASALIASLCHMGRLSRRVYDCSPALDCLIAPLPIGFSKAADERRQTAVATWPSVDFVWSGGVWDYYDPVAVVRAVARLNEVGRPTSVRFLYPPPTDQALTAGRELTAAIANANVARDVHLADRPPLHVERDGALLSSKAAICLARRGIENTTCIRLRLRDTLLYGLPLVVDRFGATATEVQALNIGLVVDSTDTNEVAEAMDAIAHDPALRDGFVQSIEALRPRFVLDNYIDPIVTLIRERRYAPDRGTPGQQRRLAALLERHPQLERPTHYPW